MRKILIVASFFSLLSCDGLMLGGEDDVISIEENLSIPPATDDGWEVSTPAAENIETIPVENLVRFIHRDPKNLHSFLVVRNSKLVVDAYFNGWHRERLHDLRSVSKSVNSILVGIATDKNYIESVHQRMFDFFPEYASLNDDSKNEIRIEHLLTMTSGLRWNQTSFPNEDDRNNEGALERSDNWIRYTLSQEMAIQPGKSFVYNSGCSNLLAGIVKESTGDHADVFAEKHLFGPLSIRSYFWRKQGDGLCNAWAGLLLRPRDMAKIGQLVLDSGKWNGHQVVSAAWIKASTTPFFGSANGAGYGYQWWISRVEVVDRSFKVVMGAGNGGQYIFVIPELNAVVVFTAGNYAPLDQSQPHALLRNVIIPSMI